jgi:hypothetical protein
MSKEDNRSLELQTSAAPGGNDWFLQHVVSMANDIGLKVGITLQMGGFLVSGMTISGEAYFEQLVGEFSEVFADESEKEVSRNAMLDFAGMVESKGTQASDGVPLFIHLKDATFFNNSGAPLLRDERVLWRGRISQVSGFVLKQLMRPGMK